MSNNDHTLYLSTVESRRVHAAFSASRQQRTFTRCVLRIIPGYVIVEDEHGGELATIPDAKFGFAETLHEGVTT